MPHRPKDIEGSPGPDLVRAQVLRQLQKRWAVWALISITGLIAIIFFLRPVSTPEEIRSHILLSSLVVAYELALLWRTLPLNHRLGEDQLLPRWGPGNTVTLLRGLLLAFLAGFLWNPLPDGWQAWIPAILYTTSDVADYFDGYLARASDTATELGARMDMEWDALGLLVASSLAIWYGKLPLIFIPIGFARYAFVFGLWIRKQLNRVNHDLPPSSTRRPIAGFTMAFMSVMLWPIVTYPGTLIAGVIFLIPFSVSFLRDWLVVSGVFDASNATYQRWRSDLREIIFEWIPIGVRLFLVVVLLWTVIAGLGSGNQAAEISNATNAFYLFLVMVGLAIPLIILGVAGRIVAFALLIPVSITIILQGIDIQLAFLLVGVLLSLILGSGKFSLWRPSDGFLFSVERS